MRENGKIAKKNVDILEDFLKATLRLPEEEYSHIQITDPYSTIDKIDAKTGSTFTELIEINTLEIPKLKSEDESPLTDWLRFLSTNKEEELKMLATRNKAIEKATTALYELSQDEKTRMLYDAREKAKWDEQSRLRGAREEGVAQGKKEGMIESAINGLKNGVTIEVIMQMTGLAFEEIEGLKKDMLMS